MRPVHIAIITALVLAAAVLAAGCGSGPTVHPAGAAPTSTVAQPAAPPTTQPAGGTTTTPAGSTRAPAWPTGPRRGPGDRGAGVLQAIHTARHLAYDRVVLQFDQQAAPTDYLVRYVARVTEDPSDRPVALQGRAFLEVVFHGASTTDVEGRPAYTGPTDITPRLPTLKQVRIAGDFERVLSFGLGVSGRSGFRVLTLANPARVVVDVAHVHLPPFPGIWDVRTWDQAFALQASLDEGHQPWRLSASALVTLYAHQVLLPGSAHVTIRQVGSRTFVVREQGGGLVATVHLTQPVRSGPTGLWAVTRVDRAR